MSWYELTRNPKAITHLYQEVPALREMVVTLCQLDPRGPSVRIEMDFPRFADHRPERWNPLWNTVAIQLDFWGIEDLKIEGFSTNPVLDFSVEKTAAGLLVRASDESTRISFRCSTIYIQKVTGYTHEERMRQGQS
jgi:hypothetical protein